MESRIVPCSVKICLVDNVPLSVFSELFPQILPLFSWKSLLNPLLEIPLYLSKLNVDIHLELFLLHHHLNVDLHGFLIVWSACYFCFILKHKQKDLLIKYESKWVRESPWKLSAYTLTFSSVCRWVEFRPLNFCLLTTLGENWILTLGLMSNLFIWPFLSSSNSPPLQALLGANLPVRWR